MKFAAAYSLVTLLLIYSSAIANGEELFEDKTLWVAENLYSPKANPPTKSAEVMIYFAKGGTRFVFFDRKKGETQGVAMTPGVATGIVNYSDGNKVQVGITGGPPNDFNLSYSAQTGNGISIDINWTLHLTRDS